MKNEVQSQPYLGYVIPTCNQNDRELQLKFIMQKYEIMETMQSKIELLENIDVVIVADDSSSMETQTEHGTRWSELLSFINICVEVVSCVNNKGLDIYFLNKSNILRNINKLSQIDYLKNTRPYGSTPLTKTLQKVFEEKKQSEKLLVLVITDGEPTDELGNKGNAEKKKLKECLMKKSKNIFVNILACTTDDTVMNYLNNWDNEIDNFDVTDDFESEKKEIMDANGGDFEFTYGTYVLKTVIGSLDPSIDNMDEFKPRETEKSRCNIM